MEERVKVEEAFEEYCKKIGFDKARRIIRMIVIRDAFVAGYEAGISRSTELIKQSLKEKKCQETQ